MPDQNVIDFIKQSRTRGVADDTIRQELSKAQWPEQVINEAFEALLSGQTAQSPQLIAEIETQDVTEETIQKPGRAGLRVALIAIAVIVVVGGAGAGYWYYTKNKQVLQDTPKQEGQKQAEQIAQDETAGWATYANTIGQYSIKYPADRIEVVSPSGEVLKEGRKIEDEETVFFKEKGSEEISGVSISAKGFLIGVEGSEGGVKSLEEFRRFVSIKNIENPEQWKLGQEVVFGGNRGIEATKCVLSDSCSAVVYFFHAVTPDSVISGGSTEKMVQIVMAFPKNPDIGNLPDIYKKILSTFILTKPQVAVCDKACLEDKFTRCEPATADIAVNEQLVYHDEILGVDPATGLCRVRSFFNANPNPDFVGKEMTCLYDQRLPFLSAVKDMSKCSGLLYTLLSGGTVPAQNPACKLTIGPTIAGNGQLSRPTEFQTIFQAGGGYVGTRLYAINFSGKAEQISWKAENPSVAELYDIDAQAGSVMVRPKSLGKTNIIVTDNAIGPNCTSSASYEAVSQLEPIVP
jgi:hypothetical protein